MVRREVTRLQAPLHRSAKHHMVLAFVENPVLIGHLSLPLAGCCNQHRDRLLGWY